MVVDSHRHFWNPARMPQPWMSGEHRTIGRILEHNAVQLYLAAALPLAAA